MDINSQWDLSLDTTPQDNVSMSISLECSLSRLAIKSTCYNNQALVIPEPFFELFGTLDVFKFL
jgi:hypothetical protein